MPSNPDARKNTGLISRKNQSFSRFALRQCDKAQKQRSRTAPM
jgi:hypothetical protein